MIATFGIFIPIHLAVAGSAVGSSATAATSRSGPSCPARPPPPPAQRTTRWPTTA